MENANNTVLVVGLGNIGREYEGTRHNVGFEVAEKIAKILSCEFADNKKIQAKVAKSKNIIVIKPTTLMNRSGIATINARGFYKVEIKNIIVLSDDFNLELGKVRVRFGGDSGGHNGLESVMEQVSNDFWRVRLGIGGGEISNSEKYVLEKFKKDEREIIKQAIDKTAHYLVDLLSKGELANESINVGPCDV